VELRELLFLERYECDLVVDRLSSELLVGEVVREGFPKPVSRSGESARQRAVDLRHRVGMADFERQLLVAKRAGTLAGLEDLDEGSCDVGDGIVPRRRRPTLNGMELRVSLAKTAERAVYFFRGRFYGYVLNRKTPVLADFDRRFEVEPRR